MYNNYNLLIKMILNCTYGIFFFFQFLFFFNPYFLYTESFLTSSLFRYHKCSHNSKILNIIKHSRSSNLYFQYDYNWYVVGQSNRFRINKPEKVIINHTPITIWKDNNYQYNAVYDICPHRGASLSKGRINSKLNSIVCPYHTFNFNEHGRLVQTFAKNCSLVRNNMTFNQKTDVPYFKIIEKAGWLHMHTSPIFDDKNEVLSKSCWIEKEAYNPSLRCVYLKKEINMDARTVTENSLDILHISEVHSFGNKKNPLPLSEKFERIDEGHNKIIYEYEAGEDSMARKIFKIKKLIVENEYILPHTTIARVIFGDFVNTVVTSALPIEKQKTILYVKTYRNNWVNKNPLVDMLFDEVTRKMMDKTLNEDKVVLETIYYKHRKGQYITKYDKLVKLYREDYAFFKNKKIL